MDQDTLCINRTLQGDFSAFEELVDKYQGRIYRHLRKIVRDDNQAEGPAAHHHVPPEGHANHGPGF